MDWITVGAWMEHEVENKDVAQPLEMKKVPVRSRVTQLLSIFHSKQRPPLVPIHRVFPGETCFSTDKYSANDLR